MVDISGTHLRVTDPLGVLPMTINNHAEQIIGELRTLRVRVDNLLANWHAKSNVDFNALKTQWDTAAQALFGPLEDGGMLGSISHTMRINYQNYMDCEDTNCRTWLPRG